jgi:DNA-binding transcriptional LysR family regulator
MPDKAPPFSALRAVEAATRHKSFTWAAKELNITHSAVSQSIRRLEAELGATLFERRGGAMQPSEAALKLAQSYAEAAQALGQAIRDISGETAESVLSIGLDPTFARLWFAPRLARLSESLPDVRVDVVTAKRGEGALDVEVLTEQRLGPFDRVLADVTAQPACAPGAPAASAAQARELLAQPLIADRAAAWPEWAACMAAHAAAPLAHLFDDPGAALESAARGAGVALADQFAVEPYVEAGRLVVLPFAAATERKLAFRSRAAPGPKAEMVERLFMWMKLEIARGAALLRRRRGAPEL